MIGYIFYSKTSKSCLDLITYMENQGIINMFESRCIDTMTEHDIIRLGLSSVPTIIITTEQNGKQQRGIYEKIEAFKWVESLVINRRQHMMKFAENNRKLIQQSEMKKRIKEGLYEYCQGESQGISDSYSYWKDDMSKDINDAQPKLFLPYGKDAAYTIMTIPEDKHMKGYKLKQNEQTSLVSNLENLRKDQDTHIQTFMEREQIQKVLNNGNMM
jgi:hypothetical protein